MSFCELQLAMLTYEIKIKFFQTSLKLKLLCTLLLSTLKLRDEGLFARFTIQIVDRYDLSGPVARSISLNCSLKRIIHAMGV